MTPEVVIDRYLATASREPFDPTELTLLLGTDADLLCRWLQLLECPADPAAFIDTVSALAPDRFHDLVMSQALAVLTVSGSARLSFDQWQSVLSNSLVAELLAVELGLPEPVAVRWRVLLAASGVNLPQDELLTELLAFRGARPELLEDASTIHRLFAVVESLDVTDRLASQEMAHVLLGVEPERYHRLLATAECRSSELLEQLGLADAGDDVDHAERLWLRLQVCMLGRLFPPRQTATDEKVLDAHRLVCRRLFGRVPELFLIDDQKQRLVRMGGDGPDINVASESSSIARCLRSSARLELIERADQSVADRQVLRHLGSAGGVCVPLVDGLGTAAGVLVFAVDEDVDQETAMALYADELVKHVTGRTRVLSGDGEAVSRFRQREEKRLRELVHEAYNPLSIVNNYLHILELKLDREPQAVEQLRLIGAELKRASDIIAQIREVPEVEAAPAAAPELAELDLNDLVRQIVELHEGYAQEYQVELSAELVPGTLAVRSDEHRLAQILNNLVRNAIEAAKGASVTVSTAGGIYREGREGALVEVIDTGPGLPRDVLDRLAEPKQTGKGNQHSGLGLHIVHRLVSELGASIDVRTAPARGTTFAVFLPRLPSARSR